MVLTHYTFSYRPLSPESCDSPLAPSGSQSYGTVGKAWDEGDAVNSKARNEMPNLNLGEMCTPRTAAHLAMINLEDASMVCRVASLEERCKLVS